MTNAVTLASLANSGYLRNRIINGNMQIDQRNAGAAVTLTSSQTYTLDRWYGIEDTDGSLTVQRSTVAPTGFNNSLLVTTTSADASLGATQYSLVAQAIEGLNVGDLGWGTASAKSITISFWVRSSLTGSFGGAINNNGSTRSYPFTYVISSPNTWEYKTITIPGDTTGTWLTTNGLGILLCFSMGTGTTFSGPPSAWAGANYVSATGATSVVGTNGATFYITGVQLEVGTQATPFEWRPYGTELQLAQRYYEVGSQPTIYYGGLAANAVYTDITFQVTKRASVTVTTSGWNYYTNTGSSAAVNPGIFSQNTTRFNAQITGSNLAGWYGVGTWTASAEL